MKVMIITVAGCSTRFSNSIGRDVLKCLYYEKAFSESLMYQIMHKQCEFDKYIIVGGYKYNELESTVNNEFKDLRDRIDLVYNEHYIEYGSGYSLFCGIKKALEYNYSQIVFAEGDLYIDNDSFVKIFDCKHSVVTVNNDPILANKAVAFYLDVDNRIKYVYDIDHSMLRIDEPFLGIYNSGQVWKFSDRRLFENVFNSLDLSDWEGTNLVFVEKYFRQLATNEFQIIRFKDWINCNTVNDFRNMIKGE